MSARTPILIVSGVCACAVPISKQIATENAATPIRTIVPSRTLSSHPEIFMQLVDVRLQIDVIDAVDHTTVLDNVMPVGERGCKAEILFDQQDREALRLQHPQDGADLLDDGRGQPLGRLIEQQELGAGAQYPPDRQHLLLAA